MPEQTKINSFKDLIVWQKSFQLVRQIYKITEKIPSTEMYGLKSQMQRSSVSIPSNIAEGFYRRTPKDFKQFLHIAFGSTAELETQLLLCKELYSINIEEEGKLLTEVSKMLRVFITKLETKD